MMRDHSPYSGRSWPGKFRDAFSGVKEGVRGQSSFFAHFFVAALVVAAGVVMQIDTIAEWCILLLCITVVFTAEMFNSAIESLAKAITEEIHPYVGTALNIGSAAVLVASLGAALTGSVVFIRRLGMLTGWW